MLSYGFACNYQAVALLVIFQRTQTRQHIDVCQVSGFDSQSAAVAWKLMLMVNPALAVFMSCMVSHEHMLPHLLG